MKLLSPRSVARRLERHSPRAGTPAAAGGNGVLSRSDAAAADTFAGYGLMSLPLESGHLLAFRRFAYSSIGPPYIAVWLRDPAGLWTFHTNVAPGRACPRYFGPALHDVQSGEIDLVWKGSMELSLFVRHARLNITLRMQNSVATRLLSAAAALMPGPGWRADWFLAAAGGAAGCLLGTAPLVLTGRAPSGHRFDMQPHMLWRVGAAAVVLQGRDLGGITRLTQPVRLGDLEIPREALFAAGNARFQPPGAPPTAVVGGR
jgi:hypothetical protein